MPNTLLAKVFSMNNKRAVSDRTHITFGLLHSYNNNRCDTDRGAFGSSPPWALKFDWCGVTLPKYCDALQENLVLGFSK